MNTFPQACSSYCMFLEHWVKAVSYETICFLRHFKVVVFVLWKVNDNKANLKL